MGCVRTVHMRGPTSCGRGVVCPQGGPGVRAPHLLHPQPHPNYPRGPQEGEGVAAADMTRPDVPGAVLRGLMGEDLDVQER